MGSFVVYYGGGEDAEKKMKDLAAREHVGHTVLTVLDSPSGPPSYKLAKDASVTVLLYVNRRVKVNYAFHPGEMTDADVGRIVADLAKILPSAADKGSAQ